MHRWRRDIYYYKTEAAARDAMREAMESNDAIKVLDLVLECGTSVALRKIAMNQWWYLCKDGKWRHDKPDIMEFKSKTEALEKTMKDMVAARIK